MYSIYTLHFTYEYSNELMAKSVTHIFPRYKDKQPHFTEGQTFYWGGGGPRLPAGYGPDALCCIFFANFKSFGVLQALM